MGSGIAISLEVYLPFRSSRIWRGVENVPAGTTAGSLPGLLGLTEPEPAVLVGGRRVPPATVLAQGDFVVILRQTEGGD